jgi:uncharacterized protein YcbX
MMGEELNAAAVTDRGLLGDRVFAFIDAADGKVASAKNPRKWGALFDHRAAFVLPPQLGMPLPPVRITLPDGSTVDTDSAEIDAALSASLGRNGRLSSRPPSDAAFEEYWPDIEGLSHRQTVTDERAALGSPPGTFFDYAAVHILTTASLNRLRDLYPRGRFESRRFRPNIVIECGDESGSVENGWIGCTLSVGDDVRLRVTDPAPRCVMPTLPQGDLPMDPGILRTLAQHNRVTGGEALGPDGIYRATAGVYARVVHAGVIHRGDTVTLC